jgi:hypothetical protein
MKKLQLLTLSSMTILSLLLGASFISCSSTVSSSSSEETPTSEQVSSSESSSIEVVDPHYDMWTEEQQTLMQKYCGEVLPYPVGLVSSNVVVEEITTTDDYGNDYSYLQIYDDSSSFTLKEYYKLTEKFGWNTIKSYSGSSIQLNGDVEYCEITKKASTRNKGYDLIYFFAEEEKNDDGEVTSTSGNILRCYNDSCSFETADSEYDTEALESMQYALTTTSLPFIKMGGRNSMGLTGSDTFAVIDYYVEDLTLENVKILTDNGFVIDETNSKKYDMYILNKTLDDGAIITAQIYFFQGNNTYFSYTPNYYVGTSWPTSLTNEIKSSTGVEIPQFPVATDGTYYAYEKNGTYYIFTYSLDTEYDYDEYNYTQLQDPSFTWNEKLSLQCGYYTDDDYNPIGFIIQIEVSSEESTKTFVSSWPTDKISEFMSETLKISGITLPSLETLPVPSMNIKYETKGEDYYEQVYEEYIEYITSWPEEYGLDEDATEEQIEAKAASLAREQMGISIYVFDQNKQAFDAYSNALYNLGWYSTYDNDDNLTYEDPTGTIAVTFTATSDPTFDEKGSTIITIHPGSGNTHEAEFYFDYDQDNGVEVGIGYDKELTLVKNMLPYDVTYSSDTAGVSVDENGKVTIDESVSEGTEATITASINVPGESEPVTATCKVVAVALEGYTYSTSAENLKGLIEAEGYTATMDKVTDEDLDESKYIIKVNMGSVTLEEAESKVTSNFILSGFEGLKEENEDGEVVDSTWSDNTYYFDDETSVDCKTIIYSVDNPIDLYLDYDFAYGVMVKYHLYEQDGSVYLIAEVLEF